MKKRVGLQRFLIALCIAVLVYGASYFLFERRIESVDEIVDNIALVLVLLGFSIRIVARGYKEDGSANGGRLVTSGLYGYIRNPMYLGTLLLGTGVALAIFNPWAIGIFWAGFAAIYIPQILREERMLSDHFGSEYRDYCARVPRLIPSWRRLRDFLSELCPRNAKWVAREGLSIVGVLLAMILTQTLVDARVFGTEKFWEEPIEFVASLGAFCAALLILSKEEK